MSGLVQWLEENKLMRYKDVFEEQVNELNDLSRDGLENDIEIMGFIVEDIGEKKKTAQKRIFKAIKKLQAKLSEEDDKKATENDKQAIVTDKKETQNDKKEVENDNMLLSLASELGTAQQEVINMLQERNGANIVSICQKMEIKMIKIEKQLLQIVNQLKISEQSVDDELASNRSKYGKICATIYSRQSEIDKLTSDLAEHVSELSGLQNRVSDLDDDIARLRKERAAVLGAGIAIGVVFGVLTAGVADILDIVAITSAMTTINGIICAKEYQIRSLRDRRNTTADEVGNTRDLKNSTESSQNLLNKNKMQLENEKIRLDRKAQGLGRRIVTIRNVITNVEEIGMTCGEINGNIETVKDLAGSELMEYMKEPLNDLLLKLNGASTKGNRLLSVVNDLSIAQQDVIKMLQEKDSANMVDTCQKMELNITRIEKELLKTSNQLKITKQSVDNELESNCFNYRKICSEIHSRQSEIDKLISALAEQKSTLLDLDTDIVKMETAPKPQLQGIAAIVGIFEKFRKNSQIQSLRDSRSSTKDEIRNTRDLKNLAEIEQNSLIKEKMQLENDKIQLQRKSQELSQQIETITNGLRNVKEIRISCGKLNGDIELAGSDLMEHMKESLNDLLLKIIGAKCNLSSIKM